MMRLTIAAFCLSAMLASLEENFAQEPGNARPKKTHSQKSAKVFVLKAADKSYPLATAEIYGYIRTLANGKRIVGINMWVEAVDERGKKDPHGSIAHAEAAGLPITIRSWKDLDGATLVAKGGSLAEGHRFFHRTEHFPVANNKWKFRQKAANEFHVSWTGQWEYVEGERLPFSVNCVAKVTGVRVYAKSKDKARELLAKHFAIDEFELSPEFRHKKFYFFSVRSAK